MGEISGGDDSRDFGGSSEVSETENENASIETGQLSSDSISGGSELTSALPSSEITGELSLEHGSHSLTGSTTGMREGLSGSVEDIGEDLTLEEAQREIEAFHDQSIMQVLEENGKYMSEADRARVANGVDGIKAVEFDPMTGKTGSHRMENGKSYVEVAVIDKQQMERSTKHEINHFASTHSEIYIPVPERNGYYVITTVGTRTSSCFHSNETGLNSEFSTFGRGLNEGLTTMYTNQQLYELSPEKGEAAVREGIYSHSVELCGQLEMILGKDTLKEAYYGGNIGDLRDQVDALAGEKSFERLNDCFDRAISKDYAERVEAMKEAQSILATMYENGGKKV